jgi:TonB family protein
MAGNILDAINPPYPEEARAKQVQGDVMLDVDIDIQGQVVSAKVLKGNPLLREAALQAVKQWRYRPYMLNDEPVPVRFSVVMKFRIPGVPYQEEPQNESAPRFKVSSGVMEGLLLHRVDPAYPSEAKEQHIQGDVVLVAVIDKEGKVARLRVVSGDPILAEASSKAVQQWKYRPYTIQGQPVEVETAITVRFHM